MEQYLKDVDSSFESLIQKSKIKKEPLQGIDFIFKIEKVKDYILNLEEEMIKNEEEINILLESTHDKVAYI